MVEYARATGVLASNSCNAHLHRLVVHFGGMSLTLNTFEVSMGGSNPLVRCKTPSFGRIFPVRIKGVVKEKRKCRQSKKNRITASWKNSLKTHFAEGCSKRGKVKKVVNI